MRSIGLFKNIRALWRREWRVIRHGLESVFPLPIFFTISLVSAVLLFGAGLWLANIELIQAAFTSENLSSWEAFRFLFELYELVFRTLGSVQLVLLLIFVMLGGLVSGFWWYALTRRGEDLIREHAGYGLVLGVLGTALGIFGASLYMPVLTTDGTLTDIDGQVYGTLAMATGLIALSGALSRLAEAADRLKTR